MELFEAVVGKSISLHSGGFMGLIATKGGLLAVSAQMTDGTRTSVLLTAVEAKALRQAIGEVMPETVHEGGLGK